MYINIYVFIKNKIPISLLNKKFENKIKVFIIITLTRNIKFCNYFIYITFKKIFYNFNKKSIETYPF